MVKSERDVRPYQELAKVWHAKDSTKGCDRLLQNLAAMRYEEQTCLSLHPFEKTAEIKGRDDCLSRAGRSHQKVTPPIVRTPF